jgi:hypothetical protein
MAPFFSGLRTSPVHDYRSRLKNHRQIFITACLNRCLDCELMCWQKEHFRRTTPEPYTVARPIGTRSGGLALSCTARVRCHSTTAAPS